MVFSSLFFLYLFLPAFILCYTFARKMATKNIVLVIFSLIFYAWGEPLYVILLIASTAVNFFFGAKVFALNKKNREKEAKRNLALAIFLNIAALAVFKYSGFIVSNINVLFGSKLPIPSISLPIGISFYTFQAMSYVIDCYWGTIKPQKKYLNFLMYVSMFPQLVAGPIVRYSAIEHEIGKRRATPEDLYEGFTRISIGLAKKVILADNLSTIVTTFLTDSLPTLPVTGVWYGIILYSMQIYFDFSGYSDMAIGLGRLMGFHFDENFRHPFLCKDVTEFWQRWHISLGTFFRDYLLYVPIFGKRRKYGGLFLVWFCTGLWHGASWNYVIWGLYYGMFILIESLIGKKTMKKIPIVIRHIYNKLIIIIGFGIFYFEDFKALGTFFKGLIGLNGNGFINMQVRMSFINNIFLIAIAFICIFPVVDKLRSFAAGKNGKTRVLMSLAGTICCAALVIISSILLVNATNHPFLYFRF